MGYTKLILLALVASTELGAALPISIDPVKAGLGA
jgi:hypothetical protein